MKLWIIDNGFDLYHGLKTRYEDYRAYLCRQHKSKQSRREQELQSQELSAKLAHSHCKCPTGSHCLVREFNDLPRVKELEGGLWRDLEESCGSVDFNVSMDRSRGYATASTNDSDRVNRVVTSLDCDLGFVVEFMGHNFYEWLLTVDEHLRSVKGKCPGIKREDLFLTFNYTSTLQRVYEIPCNRVLHVHGRLKDVEDASKKCEVGYSAVYLNENVHSHLLFGSPEITDAKVQKTIDYYATSQSPNEADVNAVGKHLKKRAKFLKKDVQSNLRKVKDWITSHEEDFSSLEEVVVAGHSLGRYDSPYFEYLAAKFKGREWSFVCHNEDDKRTAEEFCAHHKLEGRYKEWNKECPCNASPSANCDVPCSGEVGNCRTCKYRETVLTKCQEGKERK